MKIKYQFGFTLVEMAIVLVIAGLLISAFLTPLAAQVEQSRNAEVRRDLAEIKEALLGFAVINGRLPCPDNDGNGTDDGCLNNLFTSVTAGNVPWTTLDTKQLDPWGRRYRYTVNNGFSVPFVLAAVGNIRVCTTSACANIEAISLPLIVFSTGQNGAVLPPVGLDEQENTDGDANFVSRDFSNAAGGFDDILFWVSTNVLMNRMVSVGRLP